MHIDNVLIETVDYKGRVFDRLEARRDPSSGPGWFVFGRNEGYGDMLVKLCARPDRPLRGHAHYNGKVRFGWRTKRDAQAIADRMNTPAI